MESFFEPLFFIAFFLFFFFAVGYFLYHLASGVTEWMRNNALPTQTAPARILAKRTGTDGRANRRVYTTHFITFELDSGQRLEFTVEGSDYGVLIEGDQGTLTYQGTRYHGFERQP